MRATADGPNKNGSHGWLDEAHRDFVSAVFDVAGPEAVQFSPAALLERMGKAMTSERGKSHLQKYRIHRAKSNKQEFMTSYDAAGPSG